MPNTRKTRSLQEIYEELDNHSNFALFTCQPTFFEEEIKEEHWVKAMDEEIDSIENE
jgi:hypothetical protein